MKLINVPKVPAKAYNPKRNASDLLRKQVVQLEHVVGRVGGPAGAAQPARRVKTEAQAARFIAEAARMLYGAPAERPAPGTAPPEPARPAETPSAGAGEDAKATTRKKEKEKEKEKGQKKTKKRKKTAAGRARSGSSRRRR